MVSTDCSSLSLCLNYFPDCENPLPTNYLYDSNNDKTLKHDIGVKNKGISIIPEIEIDGKVVYFQLDSKMKMAVYYKNEMIHSFSEFMSKVKPLSNPDQGLLDKIALIANYLFQENVKHLFQGKPEFINSSAKLKEKTLSFRAVSYTHLTLPTNREV